MTEALEHERPVEAKRDIAKKLDAIGWGVFFIWIGVVLLAGVHTGWALAVVGLITLGGQVARLAFGLRTEGFWLVVGTCFLLGGVWELTEAPIPLAPVLLIVGGVAVVLASFWPKSWRRRHV